MPAIQLKDGITSYIFKCEEQKRISPIADKTVNSIIAKMVAAVTDIPEKEMMTLLSREEGNPDAGKKKK